MGCTLSKPRPKSHHGIKLAEHATPLMHEDVSARARRMEFNRRVSLAQDRMGGYGIVADGEEDSVRVLSLVTCL